MANERTKIHFTEEECGMLVGLVSKSSTVVENKRMDTVSANKKKREWKTSLATSIAGTARSLETPATPVLRKHHGEVAQEQSYQCKGVVSYTGAALLLHLHNTVIN